MATTLLTRTGEMPTPTLSLSEQTSNVNTPQPQSPPPPPQSSIPAHEIQNAIARPGTVQINLQGCYIVNPEDSPTPGTPASEDYEHDSKDIRLPNHTSVVSHIAVDVRSPTTFTMHEGTIGKNVC